MILLLSYGAGRFPRLIPLQSQAGLWSQSVLLALVFLWPSRTVLLWHSRSILDQAWLLRLLRPFYRLFPLLGFS